MLTYERSHLTALLSQEDVNRKAADSSKINIRRGEMHGLGIFDRIKVHHGSVDLSFLCRSSCINSCKHVFRWRSRSQRTTPREGRENFMLSLED